MMMIEHKPRYQDALHAYREARGMEPDAYWKVMLRLVTAMSGTWSKVRPFINFQKGEAHLLDVLQHVDLTGGEVRLVRLAANLFNDSQVEAVNMGDVIDALDAKNWQAVMEALRIRRGEG